MHINLINSMRDSTVVALVLRLYFLPLLYLPPFAVPSKRHRVRALSFTYTTLNHVTTPK